MKWLILIACAVTALALAYLGWIREGFAAHGARLRKEERDRERWRKMAFWYGVGLPEGEPLERWKDRVQLAHLIYTGASLGAMLPLYLHSVEGLQEWEIHQSPAFAPEQPITFRTPDPLPPEQQERIRAFIFDHTPAPFSYPVTFEVTS